MGRHKVRAAHHSGSFGVRAAKVRAAAIADPSTRCWRCGLTLAEVQVHVRGRRVFWTAGHTVDGDSSFPLRAECSACNFEAGARASDRGRRLAPSRAWF